MSRRTAPGKLLPDKVFNIAKNMKYDGYQRSVAWMILNFFDKKSSSANTSGGGIKNENMPDQPLAEELQKPIIRKFEKQKVQLSFMENIWGADLANMQLISKFNKEISFYYVLLIFSVNMHGLSL